MTESFVYAHADVVAGFLSSGFDGDIATDPESLTAAASSMQQLLVQPGVIDLVRASFREEDTAPMPFTARERRVRARLQKRQQTYW